MKSKKWSVFFAPLLVVLFLFLSPNIVSAASCSDFDFEVQNPPQKNYNCSNVPDSLVVTVVSKSNLLSQGQEYTLNLANTATQVPGLKQIATAFATNNRSITFTINDPDAFVSGTHYNKIKGPGVGSGSYGCDLGYHYKVSSKQLSGHAYVTQSRGGQLCYGVPNGCLEKDLPSEILIENITECGEPYANKTVRVKITGAGANTSPDLRTDANGNLPPVPFTFTEVGSVNLLVEIAPLFATNRNIIDRNFPVSAPGSCTSCQIDKPVYSTTGSADHFPYKICDQISSDLDTPEGGNARDRCIECVGGDELGRAGIWTAIGCIPREPDIIVKSLLRVGLGVGGGFALIIILASGFVLSVSQGEPKRIDEAKQWLTSALVGLLFIIFSVTLLHFIGYTIFQIPKFGG